MDYYRSLLAGLLLSAPAVGAAQSPMPRYYAGLGIYSSAFQRLGYHYGRTTLPVQVQAGYRWHPRWAVQLGVAYSGASEDFSYGTEYLDAAGSYIGDYHNAGHTTVREASLTLLARRTLTRQTARRFQFDAVGGLTYELARYRDVGHYTSTYPGYPADADYDNQARVSRMLVGVGPGFRFRAVTRLEVLLDVLLHAPLGQVSTGLSSSTSLGVRYHFGQGS